MHTTTAEPITLKKVIVRKAGPVRLTAVAHPLYFNPFCTPNQN